jgi:hypothetical protein
MEPAARKALFKEVQTLKRDAITALKAGDKATADAKKAERAANVAFLKTR